jgi:hypothetical protein
LCSGDGTFLRHPAYGFHVRHRTDSGPRRKRRGAMSLLISILITFLVIFLVLYLVNMLPIDGRTKQIVRIIVIIIGVISLLRYLAVF